MGGGQLYAHQLAQHMASEHDVQVVCHWDCNRTDWLVGTTLRAPHTPKSYEIDGVPVCQIGLPVSVKWSLVPWVVGYYLWQGVAIDRISNQLAILLEETVGQSDLIHNVRVGREGLSSASLKMARKWDVPFVLTPLHHQRWGGWLYRHYLQLYRRADAVIALTPHEKRTLVTLGVREERIFVTGMGPIIGNNPQPRRFRQRYRVEGPIVLFLGQKYRYKNFDALLLAAPQVWQAFPETCFVFVGPRTPYSRRRFQAYKDRRIIELGNISLEEKTEALADCDLLCVPSSQESFGGVYLEAWMFNKPVIGGPAPAVADVIEDGGDGFLTQPKPDELADRIITLLRDAGLRDKMGTRGKQKVLAHYTWGKLVTQTEAAYERVITG